MKLTLTVEIEVEHREGLFVSKDDVADEIGLWLEGADEGSVYVEDSEYEVVAWDVSTGGAS